MEEKNRGVGARRPFAGGLLLAITAGSFRRPATFLTGNSPKHSLSVFQPFSTKAARRRDLCASGIFYKWPTTRRGRRG
jgi:hypothetical protein